MAMSDLEFDAIKSARNSGVTQISYLGRTVTYRSLAEMDKMIADETERRAGRRVRTGYAKFRRDTGG